MVGEGGGASAPSRCREPCGRPLEAAAFLTSFPELDGRAPAPARPVQLTGVAEAVKATVSGALPEEGDAEAVQVSAQPALTMMEPDLEQVAPSTVTAKVHA